MASASPEEPTSTPRPRARLAVLLLLLLFGFGFAVGLHYARLGFHPLDGSIVFDGAWRILSGQVPLRDFDTPDSIVPSLLQAFAFRAFGVNWFVYCAHAAVINGLFCVVVFLLLRALTAGPWLAAGYALLSGLVLYPPFGVPFREQHAFFFTALGLLAAVGAPRVRPAWLGLLLLATLPALFAAAMLSKPNPSLFAAPWLLLAALAVPHRGRSRLLTLGALAAGALLVAAALWALLGLLEIAPSNAWLLLWERPSQIASKRLPGPNLMQLGRLFHVALYEDALLLPRVALCGVAAAALAGPALWRSLLRDDPMSGLRLLLAGGLCGVGILFRATTLNQPLVGVAFAFLIGGLVHASLGSPLFSGARQLRRLAGLLLVAAAAFDALYLSVYVNPRRVVHEIFFDAQRARRPRTPALSFMHYQVNPFYKTSAAQLDRTIAFLRRQPENFVLIGDSSILYGLTGKPSVSPSLWFHNGLTAPPRDSAAFARHAEHMMQRVEQYGVRWVVLEGKRTGMQSKLEQYPRLLEQLEASRCQVHQFGGFQIQRLDPEGRCKNRDPSAPAWAPAQPRPRRPDGPRMP
jgi:hypothetical protein